MGGVIPLLFAIYLRGVDMENFSLVRVCRNSEFFENKESSYTLGYKTWRKNVQLMCIVT